MKNQNIFSSLLVFKLRETNSGGKELGRMGDKIGGKLHKLCVFTFYFFAFLSIYFVYSKINF